MNEPSLNRARKFDIRIVVLCACTLNRVTRGDRNSLCDRACIVTCVHARTYASMFGDVTCTCMAREILVQLSTDTHNFEKYLRGATYEIHTCHLHTCFKFKLSCTVYV